MLGSGKVTAMITITLPNEIETAIEERARREGTTPERLALDGLRRLFVPAQQSPDDILALASQVYAGLSESDRKDVESIAADRGSFFGPRSIQ